MLGKNLPRWCQKKALLLPEIAKITQGHHLHSTKNLSCAQPNLAWQAELGRCFAKTCRGGAQKKPAAARNSKNHVQGHHLHSTKNLTRSQLRTFGKLAAVALQQSTHWRTCRTVGRCSGKNLPRRCSDQKPAAARNSKNHVQGHHLHSTKNLSCAEPNLAWQAERGRCLAKTCRGGAQKKPAAAQNSKNHANS